MIFNRKTPSEFARPILGWLGLGMFFMSGYPAAMYCRDIILIGYNPPANHDDFVRQLTMLVLAVGCYIFYLAFAFWVMNPIASRRWPAKPLMSTEQKHDLSNKRFFFTMIPSLVLIVVMAAWDFCLMTPFPGTEWIYQTLAGCISQLSP